MIFYETSFLVMQLEDNNTLIRHTYKKGANNDLLTNDMIKEYLSLHLNKVNEYKPSRMIMDMRKFALTLDKEMFKWIINTLNPSAAYIKKLAFITEYKMLLENYIRQATDNDITKKLPEIKYFKTEEEANKWMKV